MKIHKLTVLAVLLSTVVLNGCVAVVAGGAAVATKTATDPRTMGTQVDDVTLEARVSSAIAKDQEIKQDARVTTTAYQGNVLLTGQSPRPELSERAKNIALGVDGVQEVYSAIREGKPVELGTISSDSWITTKVRSQLLTSDKVKSSNVKVVTENGEVFLLGLVTEAQGQEAAKIASQVSGVKQVVTVFHYLK
ncbi:osmotically-inducible protein OsmY [Leminorella grimontii]|uniref:Osmotically-inducible protein OsmY n=1 Tax=Leminorella grimontii TaxID=82981 RepID=A0AAV5N6Q3_9GAMM|nr:division/outer membrane stress-associated lipid-binding lipoprotein [Leminorella grimontii]KFC94689.1 hemolysin [Leminorella grimontii ATCC 33999 = DSM 5078]GKX56431.1 osmotically-inducible protein OsmY [Leminorella grimontii]VFS61291.1 Osmotically-inducible protein Y precursor [Leminorella grimontii]